jgi:hypothetical protein
MEVSHPAETRSTVMLQAAYHLSKASRLHSALQLMSLYLQKHDK